MKDSRSALGRTFPAAAKYRTYVGTAYAERDFDVEVMWETPRSFKIRAIETTPMPGLARYLQPGQTELVSKRSIRFV